MLKKAGDSSPSLLRKIENAKKVQDEILDESFEIVTTEEVSESEYFLVPDVTKIKLDIEEEFYRLEFSRGQSKFQLFRASFLSGVQSTLKNTFQLKPEILHGILSENNLKYVSYVVEPAVLRRFVKDYGLMDCAKGIPYILRLFEIAIPTRLSASIIIGLLNALIDVSTRHSRKTNEEAKELGKALYSLRVNLNEIDAVVYKIVLSYAPFKQSGSSKDLYEALKVKDLIAEDGRMRKYTLILSYLLEKKNVGKKLYMVLVAALMDMHESLKTA
jgi:hypothetical protein